MQDSTKLEIQPDHQPGSATPEFISQQIELAERFGGGDFNETTPLERVVVVVGAMSAELSKDREILGGGPDKLPRAIASLKQYIGNLRRAA